LSFRGAFNSSPCASNLIISGMSETRVIHETLISMSAAAQRLPAINDRQPSRRSVWRWARHGLSTPAGRIYLDSAVVGGRLVTSIEAMERFAAALADARRAALAGELPDQRPQYQGRCRRRRKSTAMVATEGGGKR
jgi:hypothetical protein